MHEDNAATPSESGIASSGSRWNDQPRLCKEPGGRRADAWAPATGWYRDDSGPDPGRRRGGQHLRFHRRCQTGVDRADARGGARPNRPGGSVVSWSRVAWLRPMPRRCKGRSPRSTHSSGSTNSSRITEAVRGELAAHIPDQRGALRVYDHSNPRMVSTGSHAYLEGCRGLQQPLYLLPHPGDARGFPLANRRRSGRRGQCVARAGGPGNRPDRTGHHPIRRGHRPRTRAFGPWSKAARGDTRSPGSVFSTPIPATLDEGLFDLMASKKRFLPYLDIPLQHASRRVLKAMKRGGDARSYRRLIERARATVPDLVVRTTFIVGFPGEGEDGVWRTDGLRPRHPVRPPRGLFLFVAGGESRRRTRRSGARESQGRATTAPSSKPSRRSRSSRISPSSAGPFRRWSPGHCRRWNCCSRAGSSDRRPRSTAGC